MPAIAVTDHGNTFAAFEFYKTAKDAGIKPIIGIEAYVTPGTHRSDKARVRWGTPEQSDDDVSGSGAYTHMTLLSETTEGMHNLFRLSSRASMEGYYFKPRMDRELLQTYAKGLIATTGCPGGEVQTRLRLGQYDAARAAAAEFQDIFGKENYFAEIMDHGLSIERRVMTDLLQHREGSRHPARRHERPALHAPARRRRATPRCCACSRGRRSTTRSASSSTATATTSRRRPRCGRSSATTPRRATTRC